MKILIVNKFLYPNGGSETYIFALGRQLKEMGHAVEYFGMEHPDRCVGNSAGAYTSNIDFHGGDKLSKLTLPFKIIYSREARKKIRPVLDDFKPDVVHLNNINFQITPSIIYEIREWERSSGRKCRIVYTAHDLQWVCPNHLMYISGEEGGHVCEECLGGRYVECVKRNCIHHSKARSVIGAMEGYYYKWRKTYSMVDTVLCPSRFLYEKLSTNPAIRDRLVFLRNFVEIKEDESDSPDIKDKLDKYVLYFGRLSYEKGVHVLLKAIEGLSDIRFVIAGTGPLEEDVQRMAEKNANISYVGFKTGNELYSLIRHARFTVAPSVCYENCPFSVMESIKLNTPVLGSDRGGIPELILSEENISGKSSGSDISDRGMLFDAGDVSDFVKKMKMMWSDDGLLQNMKTVCEKTVFDSVKDYSKRFIDVMRDGDPSGRE